MTKAAKKAQTTKAAPKTKEVATLRQAVDDSDESSDAEHSMWRTEDDADLFAVTVYDGYHAEEDIIIHFKDKDVAKEYYTWVSEKVKKWQKMADQTIKSIRIKKGEQTIKVVLMRVLNNPRRVVLAESFEEAKAMEWTFLEQIDQDMEQGH